MIPLRSTSSPEANLNATNRVIAPRQRGGYTLSVHGGSEADWAKVSAVYGELGGNSAGNLVLEPSYFRNATTPDGTMLGPCNFVLRLWEEVVALALGKIMRQVVEIASADIIHIRPIRRCLIIPEGGIIVRGDDPGHCRALLNALISCFRLKEYDCFSMYWVPRESAFFREAIRKSPWLLKERCPVTDKHWYTDLPPSNEDFWKLHSAKHRFNLRRIIKKIEEDRERPFRFRAFEREDEVPTLCADTEVIVSKTYQRTLGVGFRDGEPIRRLLSQMGREGNLYCYVLYAGDLPCAFQVGYHHKGVYNLMYMAHDPSFKDYSPGTYLLLKSIERIYESSSIRTIDYGWGDATHKLRFGSRFSLETNQSFFPASPDGFILGFALSSARILSWILRRIVETCKLQGLIKRKRRLHNQPPPNGGK